MVHCSCSISLVQLVVADLVWSENLQSYEGILFELCLVFDWWYLSFSRNRKLIDLKASKCSVGLSKISGFFFIIVFQTFMVESILAVILLPTYYNTCTNCMIMYLIKNNFNINSSNARSSYRFYTYCTNAINLPVL